MGTRLFKEMKALEEEDRLPIKNEDDKRYVNLFFTIKRMYTPFQPY